MTKLALQDELRTTVLTSNVEVKCVGKEKTHAEKKFSARSRVCARERNKTRIHLHSSCLAHGKVGPAGSVPARQCFAIPTVQQHEQLCGLN